MISVVCLKLVTIVLKISDGKKQQLHSQSTLINMLKKQNNFTNFKKKR